MNRYVASGLGMTLGLLASAGRADDVIWHAPRGCTPVAGPAERGATCKRVRAQSDDAVQPPAPPEPGRPAEQLPAPVTSLPATTPAASTKPVELPPVGYVGHPAWMSAEPSWTAPQPGAGRAPKLEASVEYLLWWSKAANSGPPLLTTSPPFGPGGVPGAVPGSAVLLSAGDLTDSFRDGVRFGLTYWLDDCASYGFDGRVFFTGDRRNSFAASSQQFPLGLFRPFTPANPGLPPAFAEQVTFPGVTVGGFAANGTSNFWGAEANYRDNLCCTCSCDHTLRADLLAGFRYLHLDESLTFVENTIRTSTNTMFPDEVAGTHVVNRETFATSNDFYGGQVGAAVGYRRDRLSVDLRTTVALGTTHERLDINGGQVRAIPGGPTLAFRGGLLALPSNIGEFQRDVFSVVPEIGLNVGYQVTDHIRAFVGYNFLYWSNVIRPGDQIDPVLDVTKIPRFLNPPPGAIPPVFPPRPAARFNDTDFWAQGVNFGVEYRW
jgi:hypothetical protein